MKDKRRNILRKEWSNLRTEIERSRKELDLEQEMFLPLNIIDWKLVLSKIEDKFLYKRKANHNRSWLYNDFKLDTYSIACLTDPCESLHLLIESDEKIYFLVNETVNEHTKYWAYEGKIEAIIKIIEDSNHLDEYYLVSKKYEWLLVTNHHDILIGTGSIISLMEESEEKIRKIGMVK